jgi:hypothetical protein
MWIFFIFWHIKIRVRPTGVVHPPFLLPGAGSPLIDVVTPPRHVTLPSYGVKTSSLPPLHVLEMFRPVTSPLEPKLKHWIRTTAAGDSPQIAELPPSTTIKMLPQPCPLSHHSTASPFYLPRQSTTPSDLHSSLVFSFTAIQRHRPSAQRHTWWWISQLYFASWTTYRHVNSCKKIFWNPQHHVGYQLVY